MSTEKNYLPKLKSALKLSEEQLSHIEAAAALNFAPRKIAKYLDVNEAVFMQEWHNKQSLVRHFYDRGVLTSDFNINTKLKETAESGNITAIQELQKIKLANQIENHKNEMFDNEY